MVSSMAVMDQLQVAPHGATSQMKRFVIFSVPKIVLEWHTNQSCSSFRRAEEVRFKL